MGSFSTLSPDPIRTGSKLYDRNSISIVFSPSRKPMRLFLDFFQKTPPVIYTMETYQL